MTTESKKSRTTGLYIGIDAGSISLKSVVVNQERAIIYESPYRRHLGKVEEETEVLITDLYDRFGRPRIRSISFTGSHGKGMNERFGSLFEYEMICQVIGALSVKPDVRSVISMGGQNTSLMQINHTEDGWELVYFKTNGPCASGTGSFIDQQAERLATAMYDRAGEPSQDHIDKILAEFIELGLRSRNPAGVACRCTVFTKSDMIHLQNKGEALEDIVYGLHLGNARNYMSTIVSNKVLANPILFIGGLSLNALQVKALRHYFPALMIPPHNTSIGALGVALLALDACGEGRLNTETTKRDAKGQGLTFLSCPRLVMEKTRFPKTNALPMRPLRTKTEAYLGIDVGSTTTKYALMTKDREIIHKCYRPTQGKPIEITQALLRFLREKIGEKVEILGVATTGSGRYVVGDFLNADLIIDEITAHATGAVEIDPDVDTIFEIGGQDAKYISISNTYPLDFDMNKVCAAGTGSFLQELANKYGVHIVGEFEEIALSSAQPVKLAERCTVFMESDLVSYHQKGVAKADLMAGLCYAVVHNYLNRVVGKRRIGKRVMFLGGPSLNRAVVAAFEGILGQGLLVPRHREVLGAYGAAIRVQQKMASRENERSRFRGLDNSIQDGMECIEKVCHADPQCHNQCKLKIYEFGDRRSVWGGECGRYELSKEGRNSKEDLFAVRKTIWESHMKGLCETLVDSPKMETDGRPTVGMQRALYGIDKTVFWAQFFDALGLRLVLTPPTNEQISREGIEATLAETCYPAKVSHGHVKRLLNKTHYLFLPTLIDMPTAQVSEKGFFCPLIQSNAFTIRAALGLKHPTVLSPVIHLKLDPDTLATEIYGQIKGPLRALRLTRSQVRQAIQKGLERQDHFARELQRAGKRVIKEHGTDEPIVIVTGRPYNLYDERLNLRLGQNLAKIGLTAVPMDFVDVSSVDLSRFLPMYWGLGAQILKTAMVIRRMPNWFGLHLTNFSCGADSFVEHFYKAIMGEKVYLNLELDEHSAAAGVMTRLEAYKHVVEHALREETAGFGKKRMRAR